MKRIIYVLVFMASNLAFAQIIDLSDAKGINGKVYRFGQGYMVNSAMGPKKSQLTYFDNQGKKVWENAVSPFNFNNEVILGTDYFFHINYSYSPTALMEKSSDENPIRITKFNAEGKLIYSDTKIPNFFREFTHSAKISGVFRECTFVMNDNVYMLFSYEVKDDIEYYLCRFDAEFKVTVKKLSMKCSAEAIKKIQIGEPKLIHLDQNNAYFVQAKNMDNAFAFSTVAIDLNTLEEKIVFENVSMPSNAVSGYKSVLKYTSSNLSFQDNYSGNNYYTYLKSSGNKDVFVSTLNSYFDGKKIGDKFFFYGFSLENKKMNGIWVSEINHTSEIASCEVLKIKDPKFDDGSIESMNLFNIGDEYEVALVNEEGPWTLDMDGTMKVATKKFVEENTNPMFTLALVGEKTVRNKRVSIQGNKIYLFKEGKNKLVSITQY